MRFGKTWICIALSGVMLFTACDKKEVVYNKEILEGETETSPENSVQMGLSKALGVENQSRWKDTLEGRDHVAWDVDALVTYPQVDHIYTIKADKVYYTNEDKKRIAECLFEENSLQGNVDTRTKEDLQLFLDSLTEKYERGERIVYASENVYRSYVNYIDYEMEQVPWKEELTNEIHDFEENSYIGSKNGVEYTLDFYNDKDINSSAFVVKRRQDLSKFTQSYENLNSSENECELTVEDAEKKALTILKELGLQDMKKTDVSDLFQWYMNSAGYERRRVNGYYFKFAREIDGVAVDNSSYPADWKKPLQVGEIPYFREFVDVGIDDQGLAFITCAGMLKETEREPVDHLLSFDNIKEVIGEALKDYTPATTTVAEKIKQVSLVYLRVENPGSKDTFHYIPVWRVSPYYVEYNEYVAYEDLIWINAMDGTVIDGKKEGAITNYKQLLEADLLAPLLLEE